MAEGSGSTGVLGVIIGAVIVVAVIFFVAGGPKLFSGGTTNVAVTTPSAPSAPSTPAPSTPSPAK
jgi:hypothetical protein